MKIVTMGGDEASLVFKWTPTLFHDGRQAARKACERAQDVLAMHRGDRPRDGWKEVYGVRHAGEYQMDLWRWVPGLDKDEAKLKYNALFVRHSAIPMQNEVSDDVTTPQIHIVASSGKKLRLTAAIRRIAKEVSKRTGFDCPIHWPRK